MTTIIVTITTETPIRDPGVKEQHLETLRKLVHFNRGLLISRGIEPDIEQNFDCLKPWARITWTDKPK